MYELEVTPNELAQDLRPLTEGIDWFEGKTCDEQFQVLRDLARFCIQARATGETGRRASAGPDSHPGGAGHTQTTHRATGKDHKLATGRAGQGIPVACLATRRRRQAAPKASAQLSRSGPSGPNFTCEDCVAVSRTSAADNHADP